MRKMDDVLIIITLFALVIILSILGATFMLKILEPIYNSPWHVILYWCGSSLIIIIGVLVFLW